MFDDNDNRRSEDDSSRADGPDAAKAVLIGVGMVLAIFAALAMMMAA